MTRTQMAITAALILTVAGLMAWQRHREGLMAACVDRGWHWNGPKTRCEPGQFGPILKRALERS